MKNELSAKTRNSGAVRSFDIVQKRLLRLRAGQPDIRVHADNGGHDISVMKRLKDNGMIDSYIVESQEGPPRKYYKITDSGRAEKETLLKEWFEFVDSINALLKGDE